MNCPYCGSKVFWNEGQITEFECDTMVSTTGLGPQRGTECLERQLAQQTELLRRATELIREGNSCLAWPNTDLIKLKDKAQALLPELEKALEMVKL